ncbi:Hg(II)-responsive transcriptional regulator [Pseudidiomarina terrestris]|uniref:Mercuric resistance operon regulatory protein n=1 Tax=Pseudidiomarina terrestris TaxID=2820060 RepID=A0AAW7R052_9GAMM|nr:MULTISPECIES: Hg(II)-responsive transcriptional regulator [unclassified Pseudidiomarina]MDN7125503.1 Hg(II)-responsive transcriptional regulator [Pseudidiomarina sp. 1APP75-32.1]MDN7128065.1 Hg(II)-responsive transcriptional regulator [Pseudidiomarina sp. 1APR75-33.1]MDN7130261.1 Hg(II)-responsive transcriptional regulator [Pseudidiomarina sp. 1APR75-15]MDN7135771.1 Hg(II)-responsive transcriptional regulator [Pseudidiomarina sp. 1ASP75-5]
MDNKPESVTIGGLAKAAGVNVETIRYYQRRGLLNEPVRPAGGIRYYGSADIARLVFIKTAQKLGFTLSEVSDLLRLDDGAHCLEASELAARKLQNVRGKIDTLKRIEELLSEMVTRCHTQQETVACPLISSLYKGVGIL